MSWTILDQNDDGSISLHKEGETPFVVLTNGFQTICIESKSKSKLNDLFDLLKEKDEDNEEIFLVD